MLDVLALDRDGHGANADLLARNANVTRSLVREFARDGLLEKVGPLALRAKRCTHDGCGGLLTLYLPAPETGSGLICARCWRPEGRTAALPGDYAEPWVTIDPAVLDVPGDLPRCPEGYIEATGERLRARSSELVAA